MFRLPYSKSPAIISILVVLAAQPAIAGSSQWEETDGARLRIVTETWQPGMESLRGALQVDLEPGWKTYWREPGSAGIPPQINAATGTTNEIAIHFPVPEWVDDAYGSWAGYKHPVTLPLTFAVSGESAPKIAADVFLGICKDVCVPVTAHLEIAPASASGASLQTILVDAAFSDLPGGNSEALSIGEPSWSADGMLEISVAHAGGADATELFLSAGVEHAFAKPVAISSDDAATVFHAKPLFDPAQADDSPEITITAKHGIDSAEVVSKLPAPE